MRKPTMSYVLIVDDETTVRDMMQRMLTFLGYETMVATNGAEALEQMRLRRPCVVLLDIRMPVMDGFEFRRQQLADPALADIPVVCVSGYYEPDSVYDELQLVCLEKPVALASVSRAVAAHCGDGHKRLKSDGS